MQEEKGAGDGEREARQKRSERGKSVGGQVIMGMKESMVGKTGSGWRARTQTELQGGGRQTSTCKMLTLCSFSSQRAALFSHIKHQPGSLFFLVSVKHEHDKRSTLQAKFLRHSLSFKCFFPFPLFIVPVFSLLLEFACVCVCARLDLAMQSSSNLQPAYTPGIYSSVKPCKYIGPGFSFTPPVFVVSSCAVIHVPRTTFVFTRLTRNTFSAVHCLGFMWWSSCMEIYLKLLNLLNVEKRYLMLDMLYAK